MVWCPCPVRCKGGRDVSQSTYNRHKKEMDGQTSQQLATEISQIFPGGVNPLPNVFENTRRRRSDGEVQGARRKKARRSDGRGRNVDAPPVRQPKSFTQPRLK